MHLLKYVEKIVEKEVTKLVEKLLNEKQSWCLHAFDTTYKFIRWNYIRFVCVPNNILITIHVYF